MATPRTAADFLLQNGWLAADYQTNPAHQLTTGTIDYWAARIQAVGHDVAVAEIRQLQDRTSGRAVTAADFASFPADYQPTGADLTISPGPALTEGSGITDIPVVGPIISSIATSTGLSPTIVALLGAGALAYMFGLFDGGGKRR